MLASSGLDRHGLLDERAVELGSAVAEEVQLVAGRRPASRRV